MTSIRTCEIYEWVALFFFFLFHEFTYQWVYITYMFAYVCLWAYSSVFICIGLLLYTIEDRNYVLFTLTSPLQSAVCGILQVLKLAGRNEYACDNEYPLDVWLPCECIYILVERCFPELQSLVYLSEWVRKGQLEWGGLAEEGKLEPGSKRQQVTGVTVSLAPTPRSVGFQKFPSSWHFLNSLALFLFRN